MRHTTVAAIRKRVTEIARMGKTDDEAAHSAEDGLHVDVLRAIADGTANDPTACAREALTTLNFDFARWSA